MAAAGGQHCRPFPAQLPDLREPGILPADLRAQGLGYQVEIGEMQEEHWAVKSLPQVAFGGKLRVQEFMKTVASARSDVVNGTHAAPSHALVGYRGYQAALGELAHGVIKRADIDIGKALNHGLRQTSFDFVGVKVAAVQNAK